MFSPSAEHGIAGSANLSTVELFAYPVARRFYTRILRAICAALGTPTFRSQPDLIA
jgi:hypothetical protein